MNPLPSISGAAIPSMPERSTSSATASIVTRSLPNRRQKIRIDNVRQYQYISEAVSEKTAIVQQDKAFGVLSNRRGVVVPIQYTDVINLGTREIPLYYTERYISEAGITVLVYFDQRGKVVRSQALNNDELEKIACDN